MILTTFLAFAALQGAPQRASTNTSEATAEGVEILRRLMAESLEQAFDDKKDGDKVTLQQDGYRELVTTLWANSSTVQHSRAFHLPDVGLFLTLDASLPVVKKDARPEPGKVEPGKGDDEWERARREVRGGEPEGVGTFGRLRVTTPGEQFEIDPQAVQQAIDAVLKTCAKHAGRIEGLAPQETITVGLRLSGRGRTWLGTGGDMLFQTDKWARFGRGLERGDEQEGQKPGEEKPEHEPQTFSYVLSASDDLKPQNVVIRIALADLAAGQADIARLRQRAQVNVY